MAKIKCYFIADELDLGAQFEKYRPYFEGYSADHGSPGWTRKIWGGLLGLNEPQGRADVLGR